MSKITGRTDFSGQDSGTVEVTPEAEVRTNHDGGTAGVNHQFIPTIDDPSKRKATSTVYASDDIRLHASRSEVNGVYSGSYP